MTFNVDANGILSINAREESTGKSKNIKIRNEKGRLNKAEIDKMVSDAERFKEEDAKCRMRVNSRNLLESYLFSVRAALKEYDGKLTEADRLRVEKATVESIAWLDAHREQDAEIYDEKCRQLQAFMAPIMEKIHIKKAAPVSMKGGSENPGGGGAAGGPRIEEIY